jgi:regulatory protein
LDRAAEPVADDGDRVREAFERAVEAIGRRERTIGELREWLGDRGFEEAVVEDAVGRLIELGELDDERFARRYADDKRELRSWGAERIRESLLRRGIEPALADAAVDACSDDEELRRAGALLATRPDGLGSEAARARALAFLTRRGYELEIAYETIRRREREAAGS